MNNQRQIGMAIMYEIQTMEKRIVAVLVCLVLGPTACEDRSERPAAPDRQRFKNPAPLFRFT